MLKYTTDFYDGVTIDETTLPKSVDEFKSVIETSLEQWRLAGKKGVWLKVRFLVPGWGKESPSVRVHHRAPQISKIAGTQKA